MAAGNAIGGDGGIVLSGVQAQSSFIFGNGGELGALKGFLRNGTSWARDSAPTTGYSPVALYLPQVLRYLPSLRLWCTGGLAVDSSTTPWYTPSLRMISSYL
ncbi:hypothetical protein OPQ81_008106 [Rhizoctonia solani]|nr:hypothetical protein OPQ81_008106 [Rhizoctonia solani]